MNIYDYFDGLRRTLERNRSIFSIDDPVVAQAFDDHRGLFRARVYFWNDSHLTLDEVIDTETRFPEVLRYSYTYIESDGQHIFRYDNAPHYPQLSTFPHHRHYGPNEIAEASEQPTLGHILKEIERFLTQAEQ